MPEPTFAETTRALCLTGPMLSKMFGVPAQSIRQARLSPSSKGYRPPPDGWEAVLLDVARKRGREMQALVKALEAAVRERQAL